MSLAKIVYNKRSSKKYGWSPSWLGMTGFNEDLISAIARFQDEHGLEPDGMVGPITHRRLEANREAHHQPRTSGILCHGKYVPLDWRSLKTDYLKPGTHKEVKRERSPTMIVTHWDAALSAASCKKILEKRNISTHFVIDNDGTILQLLDCNHIAWHAGNRRVNNASIGIDFSNAYYTKYNDTYEKRGFGKRPVLEDSVVHGITLKPHLGYYPIQIEAYKKLISTLCSYYDIELNYPMNEDGSLLTGVHQPAVRGRFNGVTCHYHLTRKKIDTAGLPLDDIINELKNS